MHLFQKNFFIFLVYAINLKHKTPERICVRGKSFSAYRYLAVETFTPGPMVDTTVQDLIY